MKGMSIKKANVNVRTKEFFTDLIKNDILKDADINLSKIFKKYISYESEIRNSILNGEITFLTPGKTNDIESYDMPLRIASLRGAIAYNLIYKDDPIVFPTKVNMLKLKFSKSDIDKIDDENIKNIIKENFYQESEELFDFNSKRVYSKMDSKDIDKQPLSYKNLAHYGFNVISFPKNLDKIPSWIIPFIDIDSIVEDNMRNGIILLNSLGFNIMKSNNKEYISNTMSF